MRTSSTIGLVIAAGALCSVAGAQQTTRTLSEGAEKGIGLEPVRVMSLGARLGAGGLDAVQQLDIYNNGDSGQTTGYFAFGANIPAQVLDDVYFNRGPGAGPGPGLSGSSLLQQATVGVVSRVTGLDPIDVELRWWNTFNASAAAGQPVNTGLAGSRRITVQAPQPNGWEMNTIYLIDVDLTTLAGGGIPTTTEFGAAEVIVYDQPAPSQNVHAGFGIAFHEEYPQVGDSVSRFYYDANFNAIYESNEAFIATGSPRPNANIVLSLRATKDAGSCCIPDGTCIMATAQSCARVAGVYNGTGDCSTATCTPPGACLIQTACAVLSSAQCTAAGGVYRGNGTDCFANTCRQGSGTILLHDNGPVATGTTLSNGTNPAPNGGMWSELQGVTGCSNTTFGASSGSNGPFRIGDDFIVPTGETWTLQQMETWAYQTGSSTTVSPFNDSAFNVNVWSGEPWDLNSMLLYQGFGSTSVFSNIYRTSLNTVGTTRPLFKITHTFSSPVVLPAGHYWIEWQTAAANGGAHFSPYRATKGTRGTLVSNGIQQLTNTDWQFVQDTGNPVNCGAGMFPQEFPFVVRGTLQGTAGGCTTACYANCDGSTATPVLNVADFSCFLTKFAQQDPYANCDQSTAIPVLNVADFSCFLTKFAQGCP